MTLGIGLHRDIPADVYHADPCEEPSLNVTVAKELITRTPAHAALIHPRLGGEIREASAKMNAGSIVHELCLGGGSEFAIIDADNYKTKKAQAERDEAIAAGKLPILAREMEPYRKLADEICERFPFRKMATEVTAVWRSLGVLCRGRFDGWADGELLISDLKTCASAAFSATAGNMIRMGYDIQAAAYTEAAETIVPDAAGRVRFRFVFAETSPPYGIKLVEPAGSMRELGQRRWRRAVETWGRCLAAKEWPCYGGDVERIDAPAWALSQDMDQQINAMPEGGSQDVQF